MRQGFLLRHFGIIHHWGKIAFQSGEMFRLGSLREQNLGHLHTPGDNDGIKFVDDLTISESVSKFAQSKIQNTVAGIEVWSEVNHFRLHQQKCKEMRIDFIKQPSSFLPIQVDGKSLEAVEEAKLLGLTITSNLKWNKHVNDIISKSYKRIYLLVQLKRAKVDEKDIVNMCIHKDILNFLMFP